MQNDEAVQFIGHHITYEFFCHLFFIIQNNIPEQCSIFALSFIAYRWGKRWSLRLLEGLRELYDDEKRQKRRGKEEDSDITGGIYFEDMAVFLKKLVKSRKFYRIDAQSIRCLYIVFHEKKAPIADVCCARFLKYNHHL